MISLKHVLTGNRPRPAPAPPAEADYRAIGDSNRDAMQWTAAAEAYSRYLGANPDDVAIWVQAGNCFKEAGDFAKSLAAYRRAEQLGPANFDVHLQLGHLYKVSGNLSAALAAYERAAALEPQLGEIKGEIRDVAERFATLADYRIPTDISVVGSIEQLLSMLRKMPPENDPFISYFNSVSISRIDPAT